MASGGAGGYYGDDDLSWDAGGGRSIKGVRHSNGLVYPAYWNGTDYIVGWYWKKYKTIHPGWITPDNEVWPGWIGPDSLVYPGYKQGGGIIKGWFSEREELIYKFRKRG
mmetsp:Transcript_25646/g.89337  ORF Transcript_25646/g.89337 Transcript_25646/m.89337 type:complete len:109 (-) Transcript_25646:108-434(-)